MEEPPNQYEPVGEASERQAQAPKPEKEPDLPPKQASEPELPPKPAQESAAKEPALPPKKSPAPKPPVKKQSSYEEVGKKEEVVGSPRSKSKEAPYEEVGEARKRIRYGQDERVIAA